MDGALMFDFSGKRKAPSWPPISEAPPRDLRGLNEDWRVGDLAKCLRGTWKWADGNDPKAGEVLRVSGVSDGRCPDGTLITALWFERTGDTKAYHCIAFVKIRPDHSALEIETGIVEMIQRSGKARKPVAA
jgi:hypothetical protein